MIREFCVALTLLDALAVGNTRADLIIGGMFSPTGPNATIGLTGKNATELTPRSISGQPVEYVLLEDAVDPSLGLDLPKLRDRNARGG